MAEIVEKIELEDGSQFEFADETARNAAESAASLAASALPLNFPQGYTLESYGDTPDTGGRTLQEYRNGIAEVLQEVFSDPKKPLVLRVNQWVQGDSGYCDIYIMPTLRLSGFAFASDSLDAGFFYKYQKDDNRLEFEFRIFKMYIPMANSKHYDFIFQKTSPFVYVNVDDDGLEPEDEFDIDVNFSFFYLEKDS